MPVPVPVCVPDLLGVGVPVLDGDGVIDGVGVSVPVCVIDGDAPVLSEGVGDAVSVLVADGLASVTTCMAHWPLREQMPAG